MLLYFCAWFVTLLVLSGCSRENDEQILSEPPKVQVRKPHLIRQQPAISVSGALEAWSSVHLGFEVAGRVQTVSVHEGQTVNKGDELARLDDQELKNSLAIAEAQLKEVSRKHERLSTLYKRGSLTASDMDKIDAALAESRASTYIIRKHVRNAVLRSSIDGIVAKKSIESGTVVAPGQPVIDIVRVDHIRAVLHIPESDASRVRVGQKSRVRIPALHDRIIEGTVDELLPVADTLSRSYSAKIILKNDDGLLRPGTIALATIMLDGEEEIRTIPGEAIQATPEGTRYIFALSDDHRSVRRKQITVGGLYKDEVIVSSGLGNDELVVIRGQTRLSDGTVVQIEKKSALP